MNKSDRLGGKHGNASAFHPKPGRQSAARLPAAKHVMDSRIVFTV
jgi:hypothetical protein